MTARNGKNGMRRRKPWSLDPWKDWHLPNVMIVCQVQTNLWRSTSA
jgi:hypothetical protein